MKNITFKRGQIYYADLGETDGSEQGGIRPVIILQNDIGNKYSPTLIVASVTSKMKKKSLPTHVKIDAKKYMGLTYDSFILAEQIRTLDKTKIKGKEPLLILEQEDMERLNKSLKISFALN